MENSWNAINCEVNRLLTWSRDSVITNSKGAGKFAITETKLYLLVVTLSTQDNAKLLQQLKSGFKRTINWNKYEPSIKIFVLTWSRDSVITNSKDAGKFAITETKLYVLVVTLSTQDNAKLLQQLNSGFKRTINWNNMNQA